MGAFCSARMLPVFVSLGGGGFLAGAVLGAPIGPSGAVVASMLLSGRRDEAYLASVGVPLGHGVVAAITTVTTILASSALGAHDLALRVVAGAMLVLVGLHLATRRTREADAGPATGAGSIAGTFLLTVLNPTLFAAYALVAAGPLALGAQPLGWALGIVPAAAAIGSAVVFFGATALLDRVQQRLAAERRGAIARGLALLLVALGVVGLAQALWGAT